MQILAQILLSSALVLLMHACTASAPSKPTFARTKAEQKPGIEESVSGTDPEGPADGNSRLPYSDDGTTAPIAVPKATGPDYDLKLTNPPTAALHEETVSLKVTAAEVDITRYAYSLGLDCKKKTRAEYQEKAISEDIRLDAATLDEGRLELCIIGQKGEVWEDTMVATVIPVNKEEIPREIPITITETLVHCPRGVGPVEWTAVLLLKKKSARIKWKPKAPEKFTGACAKYAKETVSEVRSLVQTKDGITGIWAKSQIDTRWIEWRWADDKQEAFSGGDLGMGAPGKGKLGSIRSVLGPKENDKTPNMERGE